jgi:hypothetical protein
MIEAARKGEVDDRAAAPLDPCEQTRACIVFQLELDGPACLLLHDHCASADAPPADKIADLDLHDIAAAQLAIDRQIEKRSITKAPMLIEEEPYCPDLAWRWP